MARAREAMAEIAMERELTAGGGAQLCGEVKSREKESGGKVG